MLLAIDIGNSNIVFGLYKKQQLFLKWRLPSNLLKTSDSYAIDIVENLVNNYLKDSDISAVIIASVVPLLTKKITEALKNFFNGKILIVKDQNIKLDIDIKLKNSQEVGADRLINAIAGYEKFKGNLIIIDFGTATTFDVIGSKGEYLGGVITAGANLSIKALHEMTAQLPMINLKKQNNVIGKSTIEAMNSGIYFGHLSLVEKMLQRIEAEYLDNYLNKQKVKITKIITGGVAEIFKNDLSAIIDHYQPDLTLDGLNIIYQKNHENF
jgi:type III pantothenate kinase